jgi:hypothetical protein
MRGFTAEALQLGLPEGGNTGQTEMRELVQLLEQEVDRHDRYLVAIGKMDALQRRVPVREGKDRLVGEVVHSDKPHPPQFWKCGQFKDRHICQ